MSAGRPPKNPREPSLGLAELKAWLEGALATAGYSSAYQFLVRNTRFDKNVLYAVLNGTKLAKLEDLKRLAAALGRPPEEVEPIWFTAMHAMEQSKGQRVIDQLPMWETLPQPDPGARDLLLAEAGATQLLPYQLLGLESPPLPLIYVRQHLLWDSLPARSQGEDDSKEPVNDAARQETIPAIEAFGRHDHVLITGEPGSGKTALVQELTRRLARIWLREDAAIDPPTRQPVIPLLLPARAFTNAGSFTSVLAEAVRRVYGIAMLTELRPAYLAHPMKGSRWLLIIDGLDEVVDQDLRVGIIRAVAGHARADAPYQFVVTSRPLPEAELRPLRQEPFTVFSVEPFGRPELQEFAGKWFATQNPATANEQARAFLREISDGRLREAARNPLLATIAAVAKTRDPELPLPGNRVDLYERLCGYLIGDEAKGRTTIKQIRQRADESGYRATEWVHDHREDLVAWLAERYLSGESALLEAAQTWANENLPRGLGEAPRLADLRQLLTGTGLLVVEGTDLRFTHQTLAEYLAARAVAGRLPTDPIHWADFKILIAQGLDPTERTFAVFTLVVWGRAGGHLGSLLRYLLDGPPRHSLLAGRILGDCGDTRPAEATQVVDRLMDMAFASAAIISRGQFGDSLIRHPGRSEPDPQTAAPGEAFWVLGGICRDPHVAARLRDVVASDELAIETRIDAAVALGRSTDFDAAIAILYELSEGEASAAARVQIAEGILALDPAATESAETVLRAISTETDDPAPAARAAELLARIGQPEHAVGFAWSVVNDSASYPAQIITAVQIIVRHQGADGVASLLRTADGLLHRAWPALRWILIELAKSGAGDSVIEFCARALTSPETIQWQMSSVAGGWIMAAGPAAIEQIFDALNKREAPTVEISEEISLRLLETGYLDEAFAIAMDVLQTPSETSAYSLAARTALSAAPRERLPDVLSLIDKIPAANDHANKYVTDKLVQLGEIHRAVNRAKSVILNDHGLGLHTKSATLRVLRSAENPAKLADEFAQHVENEQYTGRKVRIIEAMLELGDVDRAAGLAREIIGDRAPLLDNVARMARVLLLSEGLKAVDGIAEFIREQDHPWRGQDLITVADCLASLGALATGTKLWIELLIDPSVPIAMSFEACSSLVQSGQRRLAITALRDKLRAENLPITERARVGALLSWTVLCSPQEDLDVSKI